MVTDELEVLAIHRCWEDRRRQSASRPVPLQTGRLQTCFGIHGLSSLAVQNRVLLKLPILDYSADVHQSGERISTGRGRYSY